MGADDEFDDDIAPLPPHERVWRHPAEVHHEARLRHSAEAAPPPIGRRFAMVVGMVSLAVSFSLLLVTVPKGLSSTSAVVPAQPATVQAPPKGGVPPEDPHPRAFAVDGDVLVMDARHARDGRQTVTFGDGRNISATHIVTFSRHCMTALASEAAQPGAAAPAGTRWSDLDSDEFGYLGSEGMLHVVDGSGRRIPARLGLSMDATDGWLPLDTDGVLDGVGTIVTAENDVVGYAMRCAHATWAIRYADLVQLVSDARAARP